MNFTLTFATNYNGVYINADDVDHQDISRELYSAMDEIADTFPEFTYEMCEKWDTDLTAEQEKELCDKAAVIVGKVVDNPVVLFEYDCTST